MEYLARENAAVFKDAGVEEVTVGGRVVFSSTLEEVRTSHGMRQTHATSHLLPIGYSNSLTEGRSTLISTTRLVEAVSNEHTCQYLLTQLSSPALISEEKIAQLTSSKVTGSSFLKTLGLEEEPHLLVPLVSAMSRVEQIQTLAEKMSAMMNQGTIIYSMYQ